MFKAVGSKTHKTYLVANTYEAVHRLLKDMFPTVKYPKRYNLDPNRYGNGKVMNPIYPEPMYIIQVKDGWPTHAN
ncbi:hypothetical protein OXT66_05810 [Lentilactobacillus senioris]|uniref:hypothetical protein n=1 Tax=Lentilactobacillus senioris TaxID=931534 RepID=UPI0022830F2D|nr:hypothetical protein [Lentilactobacillus senioris]MCY9807065.1 hypothetical protein [Lentilactobacillus senioris]